MKRIWILAAAVLCVACGEKVEREKIIEIPATPAAQIASFEASTRDNYQIYQVNPKLYGNSGQLKAIEGRLDEIKSLGTDILYLMPIYTEGQKDAFGSPYCIKDYNGVRASCGTLSDVKSLVSAAHSKGMKVMFDWVANHTAWDHPWITAHSDWYQKDSKGNIVYPTRDGDWKDVAQLNYSSTELQDAMIAAMKYWITEADIDGYRCDYAHGVPDDFWKKAIPELKSAKKGLIMLAESDYERMFTDGFDIIYDRGLKDAAKKFIGGGTPSAFVDSYKSTLGKTPAGKTKCYFVTNHDDCSENSPISEFKSKEGAFATYSLLAALNGSPMMYGSQETGYANTINFFDVVSIDWKADQNLTAQYKNILSALQKLSRDTECTIYGADRVVFVVYKDSVVIGVNMSNGSSTVGLPEGLKLPESYGFKAYEVKIWPL